MLTATSMSKIKLIQSSVQRLEESCKSHEEVFMGNVKLYQASLKVDNKAFVAKAFWLKEKSRDRWYKELDAKIKREIELKQFIKKELGL